MNNYFNSYSDNKDRLEYIKYGMLNEFGENVNNHEIKKYDENFIIKKKCLNLFNNKLTNSKSDK